MPNGRVLGVLGCSLVLALQAPAAAAAPRTVGATANCSSSIAFGAAHWQRQAMTFRATLDIACPLGIAFSATLRSASGCELHSSSGSELRYELFSDAAMLSPVVSCERAAGALTGSGRQSFVMYGRVEGSLAAIGEFHDALLTTITR